MALSLELQKVEGEYSSGIRCGGDAQPLVVANGTAASELMELRQWSSSLPRGLDDKAAQLIDVAAGARGGGRTHMPCGGGF